MALINCPECGKEISDKVNTCPHCGYPLLENAQESVVSQLDKNSAVAPQLKKTKITKNICIIIIVAIAIIISVFALNQYRIEKNKSEYIEKIKNIQTEMLSSGAIAEDICNLTRRVWYNTIFEKRDSETDAYTRREYTFSVGFNEDFNDSLSALYSDSNIIASINKLKEHQEKVESLMTELQNPPKGLENCHSTVESMYDSYLGLVGLAISPKGSLETYTKDCAMYDNDFMKYYHKLDTQIPKE